ncbi:MAG: hydantoinase/oxoprolinase family protein, partial [Solirubrobacteraceae bacterium]
FSTTIMNAYLSPVLRDYVRRLLRDLRAQGFRGRLLVMRSNGGIATDDEIGEAGVGALLSGPAGGVVAASTLAQRGGLKNIIGVDMGGTSYDMSVVEGGRPQVRTDTWVSRYRVGLPLLDIHTIGAGGGSVAWIDGGGALRVGPQSAGAVPGPACYGRGGEQPTVTDANLVLGYLSAGTPLGGAVKLDEGRARAAIAEHVGDPLALSVAEAAIGIHRIVNGNMTNGIRYVSVARGRDPRDYALLAFGGAAATHAPVQARDLGIRTVLVPSTAGVLSAFGALLSDLKTSTQRAYVRAAAAVDPDEITAILGELWCARRPAIEGAGVLRVERHAFVDMRYEGQVHELTVPLEQCDGEVTQAAWRAAVEAFHDAHERLYSFRMPDKPVLAMTLRLDLVGVREKVVWTDTRRNGAAARPAGSRLVWLPAADGAFEQVQAAVYDDRLLAAGASLRGPAIVEAENTTIVLHAGDRAVLDDQGMYHITIQDEAAAA